MILRSLFLLVASAALVSACAAGKKLPKTATPGTSQPALPPTPRIAGQPVAAGSSTAAPQVELATPVLPSDIVHLGVPWADFSLQFDPLEWDASPFEGDRPGLQSLTHKTIASCRITPNIPVGLGADWTIKDEQVKLGQLELHKKSFYQSGRLKFVGYYNFLNHYGDGAVEVHFLDSSDACIQATESLFVTTEVILP